MNNKKNIQNHTKARRKGVIGHDMALGTTWPQHNTTNNPQNDHPEKDINLPKKTNPKIKRKQEGEKRIPENCAFA